jgi:hypothetical protein
MAIQSVNNIIMVRATHADGTTNDETFTINRTGIAYDLVVVSNNGGAGTLTLQNGANAISGALNPADTIDTAVRTLDTGVWDSTQKVLAVGSVLTFAVSAGTLNYSAYCYIYPTPGFAA